jgi:hypothetical protein
LAGLKPVIVSDPTKSEVEDGPSLRRITYAVLFQAEELLSWLIADLGEI